jgi:DNA-binding NtrC family response regulator
MIDVLVVDDDEDTLAAISAWLRQQGVEPRVAGSLAAARELIGAKTPDLALVDVVLPDGSGLDLLGELMQLETEVVVVSGQSTIGDAIGALRLGASDFLLKPADMPRLLAIVQSVCRRVGLRDEVRELRRQLKSLGRFGAIVGKSEAMRKVFECIERVAPTDETVLITGATGTGKEVTSATIHRLSRRRGRPFVAVNCGAIAPNLIESEFFGHERGSFTGAEKRRVGFFEQADGGTLFLDEVTEMPLELQVKLLRVLEARRFARVGGTEEIEVDVRFIAATNREPEQAVKEGKLRQDLLYRLLVFPIHLPALSERTGDVPLLAQTFLDQVNQEYSADKRFTPAAIERLNRHSWPGNVRELSNVVRRAHLMATGPEIEEHHLPLPSVPASAPAAGAAARNDGKGIDVAPGMTIAEAEQQLIQATLEHVGGDKKQAAKVLGISLKTLYTRLQVYAAKSNPA